MATNESTIGFLFRQAERILPRSTVAWLRFRRGNHRYFYPFGFAMNGQTARLEATRQMLFRCGIRQIVETGTYRGTTTEWLAGFGLPVTTIEADPRSFAFAKRRLAELPHVSLEFGSSVEVLKKLSARVDRSLPTFFYLDAHWRDYLPLADEMALIHAQFATPLILIDDFEVPGDAGYGYDDYGPGKALTTEYLRGCLPEGAHVFYPSVPAKEETGRRRGWVVVTQNAEMAGKLRQMELLREAEGSQGA